MSEYVTVEERVAAGAARLDAARPDWVELIDLDHLDLEEIDSCVLGQVFGSYGAGLDVLIGYPLTDDMTPDERRERDYWAIRHGFEVHAIAATHRAYDRLQREWQGLIEDRRAASLQLTAQ